MAWHGVQIYYYDEDKDGLLLDCVRPLFEQVAAHADRLVFTRHWRRGSHLRLGVRAGEAAYRETIEPAVDRTVRPYLQTHPSTTAVDEPAMLAVHRLLAPQEQETGDLAPFRPDNSVHQDPYDRRLPTLGSEAAAALLEDFYHDTNSLVFGVLEQVRAGRSRMTVALDLMMTTAHAMWPGIERGFISYRSHAEGFIVRGPDPVGRRASCEAKYRSYAPALRERLAACLNGDAVPFTAEWISVLRRYRSAAEPLIGTGELSFAAAESGAAGASWDPEMLRHSRFHQMLQGPGGRMAALQSDPGFLAFRFALNYLYLHLNRIGIRPVERFVLCHLVARTVEEHFGITAEDFAAAGTAG